MCATVPAAINIVVSVTWPIRAQSLHELARSSEVGRAGAGAGDCAGENVLTMHRLKVSLGISETESYHLKKYKTYEELVADVERYIEFYNTQRYQAKLNNLTPLEFRIRLLNHFSISLST